MLNRIVRLMIIAGSSIISYVFFTKIYLSPIFLFPCILFGLLALGNLLPTLREMWSWNLSKKGN